MSAGSRHCLLLTAVSLVMFFALLGGTHLWDIDEAIFAQSALEMMDRDDYVVPYFNGDTFPHKPPMMYWLMIAAYQVLGPTELAARFWSAAFGLGSVLLTYQLGRLLFSRFVGLWAGLILATNLNFALIARAATPDSLLTFFCTLALLLFVRGTAQIAADGSALAWPDRDRLGSPGWSTYALVYAVMGLAVLTKGPIGVLLPTAGIGLFLLIVHSWSSTADQSVAGWRNRTLAAARIFAPRQLLATIWGMRPLTALIVVTAVAGPWYYLVSARTSGWVSEFLGVHNIGRFLAPMDNHRGPIFYYLVAVLIGLFPWSVFFLPTVLGWAKGLAQAHPWRYGYLLLACYLGVWFSFFSLASTKLPSYIIPIYPVLAVGTACFIHGWLSNPAAVKSWLRAASIILALAGVGLGAALPAVATLLYGGDPVLALIAVPLLIGAIAMALLVELGRARPAAVALAVTAGSFCLLLLGPMAMRVDQHQFSASVAQLIRGESAGPNPHVAYFEYFRPSMVFYARRPFEYLPIPWRAREFFETHPQDAFLVTSDEQLNRLKPVLPDDVVVLQTGPRFLQHGNVVVLGRDSSTAQRVGRSAAQPAARLH